MTKTNSTFRTIFWTIKVLLVVNIMGYIITYDPPEKPAISTPDYKDEITELALGMLEIKTMLKRENSLKAEMRMECSERLNNMVLQSEKMRRTVPNYK